VWLAVLIFLTGCAVSAEEFKHMVTYDPVRAEGRIEAAVRVEAAHTLSAEIVDVWKTWGNPDENIANYQKAVADMLLEDMVQSQVFASVNATGRTEYDAHIRIETAESKVGETFRLDVVVSILEPATRAPGIQYKREIPLGDSMFGFSEAMKQGLSTSLGSIRAEMLAASKGQGLRALFSGARAAQAGQVARGKLDEAQAAQAKEDFPTAMAAVRQALTADPYGAAPIGAAVALLQMLCDPEAAKRLGEEGLKAHPGDAGLQAAISRTDASTYPPACEAQARNREAVAFARVGQRPDALKKLAEARRLAPGLIPKASYNAALLLEQDGKPQDALAAYLEAYRGFLSPADRREALTRLVALAQRANIQAPDPVDRRYRLGIVRAQQKRYPDAITEFEAALLEAPWLVDAYYNLGLVYDMTGSYPDALQAFRNYVTLAPTAPNVGTVKTKIVELEDRLAAGVTGPPVENPVEPRAPVEQRGDSRGMKKKR